MLDTGTMMISPRKSVCDLGVSFDTGLTKIHISKLVSSCYHWLRRIRQVCQLIGQSVTQQLVSTIEPLQHVMDAAAQVVMNLSLHDNVNCETSIEAVTLAAS